MFKIANEVRELTYGKVSEVDNEINDLECNDFSGDKASESNIFRKISMLRSTRFNN